MAILEEPTINIAFVQQAKVSMERSKRGIVALVLKDDTAELAARGYTIFTEDDIPSTISGDNEKYIKLALIGNVNKPSKVEVYVLNTEAESYTDALSYFEDKPFSYMAIPDLEPSDLPQIESWIKEQRDTEKRYSCKLVDVSSTGSDSEGIINFGTAEVYVNDTTYTADKFCTRIAGMLAGTPITQSATYSVIPEATGCTKMKAPERKAATGNGKLICFWDGEKVKLGRAVTSFKTTDSKGDAYKKIKIVETMDMIKDDVSRLAQDEYFGKYANTHDNRCILLAAIGDYLTALGNDVIQSYELGFNEEKMKKYLVEEGIKTKEEVETMKENELYKCNYGSYVFLAGRISISDSIEDLDVELVMEQ